MSVASPTVKVVLANTTLVPATPVNEPMVSLLDKVNTAPDALKLIALVSTIALPPDKVKPPALTVVRPVYRLVPDKVKVPAPVLVSAPVVAVLAPDTVRVVAKVVTSIVDVVPALNMKLRFVDAVVPVYFKVPPPSTKLAAALVAEPKLPATPPSPIVATLKVPSLMVVAPV